MHPILILAIAISLVLTSILVFRLHAFLALTLAATVVAALTPQEAAERFLISRTAYSIDQTDEQTLRIRGGAGDLAAGTPLIVVRSNDDAAGLKVIARLVTTGPRDADSERIPVGSVEPLDDDLLPWSSDDLVVTADQFQAASRSASRTIGEQVALAFGNTCGKIGILIALAAIIGKCLLDSGAADRIVRSALRVVGESGAPAAFVATGFLLGIPVFFDTVFYLLMPLGKAMRMRTGGNYLLYILTIVAGATMAHSLVPPTPGPLLVAEELGVDLGLMIIVGTGIGLCGSLTAFCFAFVMNRRMEIPLRESPDFSLQELEALARRSDAELPSFAIAVTPILLPVLLIAGNTVLQQLGVLTPGSFADRFAETLGNKNIALGLAAAVAMATLVRQSGQRLRDLGDAFQSALASGGVIILITAAGGAFGAMLQQTGVAGLIRELPTYSPLVILTLAFLVTAAIRTAQGSGTVAMITAIGVLAGFAEQGQLGCHPVYLAAAIGCGSKPIAWMNDSGFWVICRMSGMTESEGLRLVSPMSILMGLVGLLATLLAASLFPMT